jgi:hypothetical protein
VLNLDYTGARYGAEPMYTCMRRRFNGLAVSLRTAWILALRPITKALKKSEVGWFEYPVTMIVFDLVFPMG